MTMKRRVIAARLKSPGRGILMSITLLFLAVGLVGKTAAQTQHQIQAFKITILSTMLVGDTAGLGNGLSPPLSMWMAIACS
jgi:hypothetical protein